MSVADASATPDGVVERAYELISFAAGGEPAWAEFRSLFTAPCVLALRVFPGDDAVRVLDMDGYVRAQMDHDLGEQGYAEVPGGRTVDVVGDVAAVRQSFAMHYADGDVVDAVDLFHLVRHQGRWSITAIASDTVARTG